jgi:hypothetical protein
VQRQAINKCRLVFENLPAANFLSEVNEHEYKYYFGGACLVSSRILRHVTVLRDCVATVALDSVKLTYRLLLLNISASEAVAHASNQFTSHARSGIVHFQNRCRLHVP